MTVIDLRPQIELAMNFNNLSLNDSQIRSRQLKLQSAYEELLKFHTHEQNGYKIIFSEDITIEVPFTKIGEISVLQLLAPHEIIIFANYFTLSGKGVALDMGSNFGLHSVLLSLLGWDVTAIEPDPETFGTLQKFVNMHQQNIRCLNAAVVPKAQRLGAEYITFVRVEANPTASGIKSGLKSFYGQLSEFSVRTTSVDELSNRADLVKIDIEGAESLVMGEVLSHFKKARYIVVEISNLESRSSIYRTLISENSVLWYSDSSNIINPMEELLPSHYTEGSLHLLSNDMYVDFNNSRLQNSSTHKHTDIKYLD